MARRRSTEDLAAEIDPDQPNLEEVLEAIHYGLVVVDESLHIRAANRTCRDFWRLSDAFLATKPALRDAMQRSFENGLYNISAADWPGYLGDRLAAIRGGTVAPTPMELADGRTLQYECRPLPGGGRVLTYFDISERTVRRDWQKARALLKTFLADDPPPDSGE